MTEQSKRKKCPCVCVDCERHADCQACRAYHHARGQGTTCERQGE